MYRDHFGNLLLPRVGLSAQGGGSHIPSPSPRRTFHNVIPRGRNPPPPPPPNGLNMTWSGWEGGGFGPPHPKPPEHVVYGDVVYGDYQKFAINGNVCMCEDYLGGTNRGKKERNLSNILKNFELLKYEKKLLIIFSLQLLFRWSMLQQNYLLPLPLVKPPPSIISPQYIITSPLPCLYFDLCLKGTKRCKKCGFDRPGTETYRGMRRSLSSESVNNQVRVIFNLILPEVAISGFYKSIKSNFH